MLPHTERGTGPALVLLHAGLADRSMWDPHLDALAATGLRVIALDLPGFGDAPVVPGEQAPWIDVLATLDALGVEQAALVGSSFGGAVALRAAAVHRGRFWALVLVSAPAPGLEPSPQLEAVWAEEDAALAAGDLDAAAETVAATWLQPGAPLALRDRVAGMQRRALELQQLGGPQPEARDPLADPDDLTHVRVPTLVLCGEHDLPDFREGARLLVRLLPDARREVIDGAGHLAPLETPAAFEAALLAFVREHRPTD